MVLEDYTYEMRSRYSVPSVQLFLKYFYSIIGNCAISLLRLTIRPEMKMRRICARQAYATRAYSYFMLIQSSNRPTRGMNSLRSSVYTEPTTSASKGKGRGTVAEVYSQIDSDLNEALVLFEESGVKQKHVSHLDFYSTSLLKARVALVENDWQAAADAAAVALGKPGKTLLSISEAAVIKGLLMMKPANGPQEALRSILWILPMFFGDEQSNVFASFSMMDACTMSLRLVA